MMGLWVRVLWGMLTLVVAVTGSELNLGDMFLAPAIEQVRMDQLPCQYVPCLCSWTQASLC